MATPVATLAKLSTTFSGAGPLGEVLVDALLRERRGSVATKLDSGVSRYISFKWAPTRVACPNPPTPTPPGSKEPTEATTCRSPESLDCSGFFFVTVKAFSPVRRLCRSVCRGSHTARLFASGARN